MNLSRMGYRILWHSKAKLLFLLLLPLLAFDSQCRPKSEPHPESVRIGYLPHHGFLPLFVAIDNGLTAKHGVQVDLIRFESSPALGTAFINGQLDAAPISTSVALGIESRDPGRFKVFAVSSETKAGYLTAMVALKRGNIKSVADLRGKKIGVFPGPAAKTLFGMVLAKHGLDPRVDVSLVELPPPIQLQALSSGQVDALATYEPIATQAVLAYGATKFFPAAVETDVLSPTQGGLWIISDNYMAKDSKSVRGLVLAIYDAIDFIRREPRLAAQSIVKYTGVSSAVASQLPVIPYSKLDEVDMVALQRHADILTEHGILNKKILVAPLLLNGDLLKP